MISNASPTLPRLPVELVETIISEAWSLKMTNEDRAMLFASFCLINHDWLTFFIRITLKDVHIISPSFTQHYLGLIHYRLGNDEDHAYFISRASVIANNTCRSLTFRVDGPPSRIGVHPTKDTAMSVSNMLYMSDILSYLPNMRRVSIEYVNWGYGDVFDQYRIVNLPHQVTHLELMYTFDDVHSLDSDTVNCSRYRTKEHARWYMPGVRKLTVIGAPPEFVHDILSKCPNVKVLELDMTPCLDVLVPLPSSVRTVRLCESVLPQSKQLTSGDLENWCTTIKKGWFSSLKPSRIILESSKFQDGPLKRLEKTCRDCRVEFVYISS